MSWDIILEKPLPGASCDLFDERELEEFDIPTVQNSLRAVCPCLTEVGSLWMRYDAPSFEIEFDLAEDFIMLHVHILQESGETQFLTLLRKICEKLQCRAFDTGGGFLF